MTFPSPLPFVFFPSLLSAFQSPAQASARGVHDGREEYRTGPTEQGPRESHGDKLVTWWTGDCAAIYPEGGPFHTK